MATGKLVAEQIMIIVDGAPIPAVEFLRDHNYDPKICEIMEMSDGSLRITPNVGNPMRVKPQCWKPR